MNENTFDERKIEVAPVLLILGIVLVVLGFFLIALVTIWRIADPMFIVEYSAFGLFVAGIVCIWRAWLKLS